MSIHIILGKPGSGKSMYGTYKCAQELLEGTRNIVTNLPLRPDKFNEYLNAKFPTVNTRFVERLRIMTDEEMRHFWDFRGPPIDMVMGKRKLPDGTEETYVQQESQPNGNDRGNGVAYFLDEAHIAFNARDWATLGRQAIHYMSQHRKLGDVVWPITQSCGNLDKQFRSVAEDYTVLRNEYTAKMGMFRGMGRFVRKSYYSEPQGKGSEPFETATFHIDTKGVAACYDTAKGIGVHGSKADIGRRAKGIPIWVIFPIFIVLGSLCVFIPFAGGHAASAYLTGGAKKQETKALEKSPELKSYDGVTHPSTAESPKYAPAPVLDKVRSYFNEDKPRVAGVLSKGGQVVVVMGDGSLLYEDDPEFEGARRGRIKVKGVWLTPSGATRGAENFHTDFTNTSKKGLDKQLAEGQAVGIQSYDGVTQPKPQNTKTDENPQPETPRKPEGSDPGRFSLIPTVPGSSGDPRQQVGSYPVRVLQPRQSPDRRPIEIRRDAGSQVSGHRP